MNTFVEKLAAAQSANQSWLCVGLDPLVERMPTPLPKRPQSFLPFLQTIIEATADLVCAYKPNLAFYLAHGVVGLEIMIKVIDAIPNNVPVILDAKFNDIGHTAQAYATAAFTAMGADAVTTNPYLGQDGIAPFLAYADRAIFLLARTSNPSAKDFQDRTSQDETLYQAVARQAAHWNRALPGTCGLVVGATYPQELAQVRELAPDLPFLIPGIGTQGGNLPAAAKYGPTRQGLGPVINTSRGVLYASSENDYAQAARQVAEQSRQQIRQEGDQP